MKIRIADINFSPKFDYCWFSAGIVNQHKLGAINTADSVFPNKFSRFKMASGRNVNSKFGKFFK